MEPEERRLWSDQLDALLSDTGLAAPDDCLAEFSDSGDEPISPPSEENEDMEQFTLTQVAGPLSAGLTGSSGSPAPPATQDLREVCCRTAARLGIA